MGDFSICPAGDGAKFGSDFAEIIACFTRKRGDARYNRKTDVSPVDLKPYLPWISLFVPHFDANGKIMDALVTLQGSDACGAYKDCTGGTITAVHPPLIRDRVLLAMQYAVDIGGAVIGTSEEHQITPPQVRVKIMYIPMAKDGETISHFFGYMRLEELPFAR